MDTKYQNFRTCRVLPSRDDIPHSFDVEVDENVIKVTKQDTVELKGGLMVLSYYAQNLLRYYSILCQ